MINDCVSEIIVTCKKTPFRAPGATIRRRSRSKTREIGHGDEIYAIDSTQRVILIYTPDTPPSELLAGAKQLAIAK